MCDFNVDWFIITKNWITQNWSFECVIINVRNTNSQTPTVSSKNSILLINISLSIPSLNSVLLFSILTTINPLYYIFLWSIYYMLILLGIPPFATFVILFCKLVSFTILCRLLFIIPFTQLSIIFLTNWSILVILSFNIHVSHTFVTSINVVKHSTHDLSFFRAPTMAFQFSYAFHEWMNLNSVELFLDTFLRKI